MKNNFFLKLTFLFFLFGFNTFFSNWVFAIDEVEETLWIEQITYEGHLWKNTIIDIIWNDLDECSDIYIDWKPIFVVWKSNTKFSFNYSSVWNNRGYWELKCDSKNIKFFYKFPYIEFAEPQNIENFKRRVKIKGENFWKDANVVVDWGWFEISANTWNIIMWGLSKDTNKATLYVEVDWMKSNKVNVEITIPKIHFAYAPEWFYPQKSLFIWWDNLNSKNNTQLYINDEKHQYSIDSDTQSIKTSLNREPWTYVVSIEHNWIVSNSLDMTVVWDKPVIKKWYKSSYKRDDDSIPKNAFSLDMNDVDWDISWIKVWHNGKSYNVNFTESDRLFVDDIVLTKWINYFYVESYGTFSDVYSFDNGDDKYLPFIRGIKLDWFNDDQSKRILRVDVWYYDDELDSIYFWPTKILPEDCVWNVCTFLLNANILYGSFNVEREWIMSVYPKIFDVRTKNIAYIEWISLLWTERGNRIKVFWDNFYWWQFSDWDIFSHNNQENATFDLNRKSIVWKLQRALTQEEKYTIWFTQYGYSVSNSFTLEDFEWKDSIIFPALLLSAGVQNEVFAWEEMKIYGFGFWVEDTIHIGWNTLKFKKVTGSSNKIWYVEIPSYFPLGSFNLKITNSSWKDSKTLPITILPPRDEIAVSISTKWTTESFYQNESVWSTPLHSVTIWKLYSDVIIEKIWFTLESVNQPNYTDIGTFLLYLNWRQVWYSHVNKSGQIIFNTPFEVKLSSSNQILELRKKSPFTYEGRFSIKLDSSNFVFQSKKTQLYLEAQFQNILAHSFTILPQKFITCVQSNWAGKDVCKTLWENTWLSHTEIIRESTKDVETQDTIITVGSWYKWELGKRSKLLKNFQQWELYVNKVNTFLPDINTTKLLQAQHKLKLVDMSKFDDKPMFEALIYFLKAAVDYELSLR